MRRGRRRWPAVSRATTSAERFPAEPPATKHPPAPGGMPASVAMTPSAWFSATTTPAASSQEVPCREEQDTNMSKSRAALVGAAGMNERKRGLSQETTAVASLSTKSCNTSPASFPSGRINPDTASPSAPLWPPKSSGTGSSASRSRQAARTRSAMASSNSNMPAGIRPGWCRPAAWPDARPARPARPPPPGAHPSGRRSGRCPRIRAWPVRLRPSCAPPCRPA